jgi:hypothetical protein
MEYITQIDEFIESYKNVIQIDNNISNKDRADLHEYCKKKGLFSRSITKEGTTQKIVIVTKNKPEIVVKNIIDDSVVDFFDTHSNVPIPVPKIEFIDYYLELFDPIFNCKRLYNLLISDVIKFGDLNGLKREINKVTSEIYHHIEQSDGYKKYFLKTDPSIIIPDCSLNYNIYNPTNDKKWFISIDIKSANFRVLKNICNDIFTDVTEFSDFVGKYTESEFIKECKMIREIIFGRTGQCKKINKMALIFVNKVDKLIESTEYIKHMKKIMLSADEVVYEIDDYMKDNYNDLVKLIEEFNSNFFHVRMFKLVKICNKPFYMKELIDGKLDLKQTPKKFACQVVKKYFNKEIIELDRKFVDEGYIATYDLNCL